MQEADLPWVLALESRSYDFPWSKKGFENCFEQGLSYVFYSAEGKKLGYCCILTVLDEAHILNVCVATECRGQGVAKAALIKVLSKLESGLYRLVLLEVRHSNQPAIKLYQSLNFHQDGVRKNYYRVNGWDEGRQELVEGREDAILMSFACS